MRGGRPHLLGVQVDSGKDSQREAGGGALGRVRGLSLCLLQEVEDDWQAARWLGQPVGRQVSGLGRCFSYFLFSFSISDICFISKRNVKTLP